MEIKVKQDNYQHGYLLSQAKFPCMKSGIGTGKTLMLLLKIYDYCEKYPGTTALIVRKEFTDLKDSTIRDFQSYFSVTVGHDKDYLLPNGSKIMFRHGAEIEVLKNINLGIAGIEQAEEFDEDTQFQFIRDRLRQQNGADIRPLCVIANANGHNWVWKLWLNGAEVKELDSATGQFCYHKGEYECYTATSFANERHLPVDFIADLKRRVIESPNHYRQYILNADDVTEGDDYLFSYQELKSTSLNKYPLREGYGLRLAGFDIARYGDDKCACVIIQQMGALHWEVVYTDQWEHKDLNYTTGRILSISNEQNVIKSIIDEDGIGAGPLDTLNKGRGLDNFTGFRNPPLPYKSNKECANPRTVNAYKLKKMIGEGHFVLTDEQLIQELTTLRFTYDHYQRKILVSKEKMRAEGIASPNLGDACLMACSLIGAIRYDQVREYEARQPALSPEGNLFEIAGIK